MKKFVSLFLRTFLAGFLFATAMPWSPSPVFAARGDAAAVPDEGAARNSDIFRVRGREDGSTTNFVAPGVDDTYTSGTGALRWSHTHTMDLTVYDDLNVSDTLTVDDLTVNGNAILGAGTTNYVVINATGADVSTTGLFFSTNPTGDNTNIITLDGTNYRLGVNDTTPDAALDVGGKAIIDDTVTASKGVTTSTMTTTGNADLGNGVTDVVTINALFGLTEHASPNASVTPTRTNQFIWNTATDPDQLCVSTAAVAGSWVAFSTPTTACAN